MLLKLHIVVERANHAFQREQLTATLMFAVDDRFFLAWRGHEAILVLAIIAEGENVIGTKVSVLPDESRLITKTGKVSEAVRDDFIDAGWTNATGFTHFKYWREVICFDLPQGKRFEQAWKRCHDKAPILRSLGAGSGRNRRMGSRWT